MEIEKIRSILINSKGKKVEHRKLFCLEGVESFVRKRYHGKGKGKGVEGVTIKKF